MQAYMDTLTNRMRSLDYYMQLSGWEMNKYVERDLHPNSRLAHFVSTSNDL